MVIQAFFFDNSGNLITIVPKLPRYSSNKYRNQLYKETKSKQFDHSPKDIYDVLPNSFIIKHGYINCTIKYDNLSQQERNQIETDIKNSYQAFKKKFCLQNNNVSYDIEIFIFNNRSDYTKYNDLLGMNADGGPGYITRGVTNGEKILIYKQNAMDFVLSHELGHIFQLNFSPSEKVKDLNRQDTEFIANVIGQEVEEINYKAIYKQKGVDEDENQSSFFSNFIFPAIEYITGFISSFFLWLFRYKEPNQHLLKLDANEDDNELDHSVSINNHDLLDDYNHYHSSDELM